MQLFYDPNIKPSDTEFFFSKEESRHIVRVLRKREQDTIQITNGKGYLFEAVITLAEQKQVIATIKNHTFQEPKNYSLHMVVAPTKMNDRYEWFLEKATEIGVDEITPIICEHSERKVVKIERFTKIVQSAMKQSLNYYLPKLNTPISFNEFINNDDSTAQKFIAHCEKTKKAFLKDTLKGNTNSIILIGPEGDFSTKEIELAKENNYLPVSLGSTRLRTETAAIVACHSVAFINE